MTWSGYAAGGISHYWVVDPEVPRVTAWTLVGERYERVGDAEGESGVVLTTPWRVVLVPSALARP